MIIIFLLHLLAGYTLRYNSALFFQVYYPGYDVGWWLTLIYSVGGVLGSILGGVSSDKLVKRMGVRSRAIVLAVGQVNNFHQLKKTAYFCLFNTLVILFY